MGRMFMLFAIMVPNVGYLRSPLNLKLPKFLRVFYSLLAAIKKKTLPHTNLTLNPTKKNLCYFVILYLSLSGCAAI